MKKVLIVTFLILSMLLTMSCSKKEKKDVLRVGMELAYPPFETITDNGTPKGVSVDLATELGKHLGLKVEIKNMEWSGLIPSLRTNKIDIILSSMSITDERKKVVDFSVPYAKSSLALFLNKNSKINGKENLDIAGNKIIVKKGTIGHIYADNNIKNADIIVLDNISSCKMEVVQGKADAFIYDQLSVINFVKESPEKTRANLAPLIDSSPWGIALKKGNDKLKNSINAFLTEFKKKKGFEPIIEKYLKDVRVEFEKQNQEFFF